MQLFLETAQMVQATALSAASAIGGLVSGGSSELVAESSTAKPLWASGYNVLTVEERTAATTQIETALANNVDALAAQSDKAMAAARSAAAANPPSYPGLSFSVYPIDVTESVLEKGILSGQAMGEVPANSWGTPSASTNTMAWFSQERAFWADGSPTAIFRTEDLVARGAVSWGSAAPGPNGVPSTLVLPYPVAPQGMPPGTFAIGITGPGGSVKTIWTPPGWQWPAGVSAP